MSLNIAQRRAETVTVVFGALFLIIVLLAGYYVFGKYEWAKAKLAEVEPRYARLLGLRESAAKLTQGIKDAREAMARLGHAPDRNSAQIGNELQQTLRRALQSAGLSLTNSQVLPPRSEKGIERIAVAITFEGSLAATQLVLAALQGESPVVANEQLNIQSTGRYAPDGSPFVTVRQTLSVMRVGS